MLTTLYLDATAAGVITKTFMYKVAVATKYSLEKQFQESWWVEEKEKKKKKYSWVQLLRGWFDRGSLANEWTIASEWLQNTKSKNGTSNWKVYFSGQSDEGHLGWQLELSSWVKDQRAFLLSFSLYAFGLHSLCLPFCFSSLFVLVDVTIVLVLSFDACN